MTKFVTFGETMAQYNARYAGEYDAALPLTAENYLLDCAGAESNVASNLLRLEVPGVQAAWVSRLGDDDAGRFIQSDLKARPIAAIAPIFAGEKTGISYLNHHADGAPIKTYARKGSAASRLTFADVQPHLRSADLLHITGITPALSAACHQTVFDALDCANANGIPVSFDLNYREQLWAPADAKPVFERMAAQSALFKLGEDEAAMIWGKGWDAEQCARHFQRINGGVVVVTRGDAGALAFDGESVVAHAGYRVDAIDPVGAGDAFVAGLLAAILDRHRGRGDMRGFLAADASERATTLAAALRLANVCGALVCTRHGDTAAMPTREEASRFITAQRQRC